jgi:1-acyl-sn-glycerol-3-phosphate acyltransferase
MLRSALRLAWGIWCWVLFVVLLSAAVLAVILLPSLRLRRDASRSLARAFFRLAGFGFTVEGLERLPDGPAVAVANHASYVDGPLLCAALPSRFGFVIKKEALAIPVAGRLLRRLGHEFVDRYNPAESAKDTRRILRAAVGGGSVVFFPEGTFAERPGLARFHSGAFVTASRAGMPVVPVVIHGARRVLPSGAWLPRRSRLQVEILAAVGPLAARDAVATLRQASRAAILARLDEPDLADGVSEKATADG